MAFLDQRAGSFSERTIPLLKLDPLGFCLVKNHMVPVGLGQVVSPVLSDFGAVTGHGFGQGNQAGPGFERSIHPLEETGPTG